MAAPKNPALTHRMRPPDVDCAAGGAHHRARLDHVNLGVPPVPPGLRILSFCPRVHSPTRTVNSQSVKFATIYHYVKFVALRGFVTATQPSGGTTELSTLGSTVLRREWRSSMPAS